MDGTAFLVLLIIVAFFFFLIRFLNKNEEKIKESKEKEADKSSAGATTGSTKKPETKPISSASVKGEKKSLDAIYAESHGMRVCKYCQTLNASGAPKCAACGKKIA